MMPIVSTKLSLIFFQTQQPLTYAQLDCESPPMPLYKGMWVMIMQNTDKPNGVVNGQLALIHMVQNRSVLLKFSNKKIVAIYPVTVKKPNTPVTLYPLVPAYATTMCKAQGQTLRKVVLWCDIDNIPPGTMYVTLSHVKNHNDIHFLNKLKPEYFKPVIRAINCLKAKYTAKRSLLL